MFKPVSGDALSQFDPETVELYKRRPSNPDETRLFIQLQRRARNHLPYYFDKETNPKVQMLETSLNGILWKSGLLFAFFGR